MTDYDRLHEIAREDVHTCIEIWKDILSAEDREVEYAYAKGSATKKWDSPIDYVPEISDVDIHVLIANDEGLFRPLNDFNDAMQISERYETRFFEVRQDALHMPRSQIMILNRLKDEVEYCPPRISDVQVLFGEPKQEDFPSIETIRRQDLSKLLKMEDYLEPIPRQVFDRAGHDLWYIIRSMTWRVSPSPVRLLSQIHEDPITLWSWNRTRIEQELCKHGYEPIADSYRGFYMSGWDLFLSEFKNLKAFRSVVQHGYDLLKQCLDEGNKISRR